jgi:hypothetical protein
MDSTAEQQRREQAVKRIKAKHAFKVHLLVYVAVNTALVVIWAVLAIGGWSDYVQVAPFPSGFFWPIFPIVGWGIGVAINGYVVYRGNVITEAQIQRELKKVA